MGMTLQILVPQYKETDDVIKPLLDSISLQQNVDFSRIGVIIVNDGTDVHLSEGLLQGYPFEIQYVLNKHGGVSATRNKALDLSTADYVMFCDADDMFVNLTGLWLIMREIDRGGFYAFISNFMEEGRDNEGKPSYVNHEQDHTFVHGKVYKRRFLLDASIRWKDSLTLHEDGYFNGLALRMAPEVKYCKTPFYLWKYRADSVARADPLFVSKTYPQIVQSSAALVEELIKRGHIADATEYVAGRVFETYFIFNDPKQDAVNEENIHRFRVFWYRFKYYFDKHPNKEEALANMKGRDYEVPVSFEDWLANITRKEK